MTVQFFMDGHTYYYDLDNEFEGFEQLERVVVTDHEEQYVGELELIHNSECANIRLNNGDVTGVRYYEMIQHSPEHLARIVVGSTY